MGRQCMSGGYCLITTHVLPLFPGNQVFIHSFILSSLHEVRPPNETGMRRSNASVRNVSGLCTTKSQHIAHVFYHISESNGS